jgi:hypothetical protein
MTKTRNQNHPIFRPPCPREDSCIAAIQLANERYVQHKGERAAEIAELLPSEAGDDDLPQVFWEISDGHDEGKHLNSIPAAPEKYEGNESSSEPRGERLNSK